MGKPWIYLMVGSTLCFLASGAPQEAVAQCFAVNQLGSVNSTTGKPFQAEVHESIPTFDYRLYPRQRERKSIVARDSQGRVRTEMYLGMIEFHRDTGQEVDLTHLVIEICDPVGLQHITIDQQNKTARVINLPPPVPSQKESMKLNPRFCNAQMDLRTYPPTQDREDLGHQNIEGVDVRGVAVRSESLDTEIWCSDELETVVLRETRGGSHIAMTNIQRVEPDPALFVVPAGYKKLDGFF